MKLIVYAGSRLLTGDEIAIAVLEYCAALADAGTAETVKIPVLAAEGLRSHATLLVGPSSQMVAEDVVTEFDELLAPEAVKLLRDKTRVHRPVAGSSERHDQDEVWENDW